MPLTFEEAVRDLSSQFLAKGNFPGVRALKEEFWKSVVGASEETEDAYVKKRTEEFQTSALAIFGEAHNRAHKAVIVVHVRELKAQDMSRNGVIGDIGSKVLKIIKPQEYSDENNYFITDLVFEEIAGRIYDQIVEPNQSAAPATGWQFNA